MGSPPVIRRLRPFYSFRLPYRLKSSSLFSGVCESRYDFHPGQKRVCHFQNLPISDSGALSYFARMAQFSQLERDMDVSREYDVL